MPKGEDEVDGEEEKGIYSLTGDDTEAEPRAELVECVDVVSVDGDTVSGPQSSQPTTYQQSSYEFTSGVDKKDLIGWLCMGNHPTILVIFK